jgi:hypothetical protein
MVVKNGTTLQNVEVLFCETYKFPTTSRRVMVMVMVTTKPNGNVVRRLGIHVVSEVSNKAYQAARICLVGLIEVNSLSPSRGICS